MYTSHIKLTSSELSNAESISECARLDFRYFRKESPNRCVIIKLPSQNKKIQSQDIDDKILFRSEIITANNLDHPNVLAPTLVQLTDQPTTVGAIYESSNLMSINSFLKQMVRISVELTLDIVIQILDIISHLHRKNLVHGDINPFLFMIDKEYRIYLLDIGVGNSGIILQKNSRKISFTFPFVSPEHLGLTDQPIETRSDLYSIGLLLYNMLTGEMPFQEKNTPQELIQALVRYEPPPIERCSQFLNTIIDKSLQVNIEKRYQTADGFKYDVLLAKKELHSTYFEPINCGQHDAILSINKSNLFVSREQELTLLKNKLSRLIETKTPSSILICGISGSGKTEVIRRFEQDIPKEKVLFLASKCNRQTHVEPFSLIRHIVLEFIASITNDKKQLSVVKKYFDEELFEYSGVLCRSISELKILFTSINKIDEIDRERETGRVIHAFVQFFTTLSKFKPSIIFADDLQWIDKGSFEVVKNIIENSIPIMLICSFRTAKHLDNPLLYNTDFTKIVNSNIALKTFTKKEIDEFLRTTLGSIINPEKIIDALMTKTDCLPLTLREAIKYLVSNSIIISKSNGWEFEELSENQIPECFDFPSLILSKFNKLSIDKKEFLFWVSMFEGKFDPIIFSKTGHFVSTNLNEIITDLVEQGFLVWRYGTNYSFSHDKIQESISNLVSDQKKKFICNKIADVIENLAKDDTTYLPVCAEFYIKSENYPKILDSSYKAAIYSVQCIAFDNAISFFTEAIKAFCKCSKDEKIINYSEREIKTKLGEILIVSGYHNAALSIHQELLSDIKEYSCEWKEIQFKIGKIYSNQGAFNESLDPLFKAIGYSKAIPYKKMFTLFLLIYEILNQLILKILPSRLIKKFNPNDELLLKLKALNTLTYALYFCDTLVCFWIHFKALNLADRIKEKSYCTKTYIEHAIFAHHLFLKKRVLKYYDLAFTNAKNKDDIGFVQTIGATTQYFTTKWEKARSLLNQSISFYSSIGDKVSQFPAFEHLWRIELLTGNFKNALKEIDSLILQCEKADEYHYSLASLSAKYYCEFIVNSHEDLDLREKIENQLEKVKPFMSKTHAYSFLIEVDLLQKRFNKVKEILHKLIPIVLKECFNTEYVIPLFVQACEVNLLEKIHQDSKIHLKTRKEKSTNTLSFWKNFLWLCFFSISYPTYKGNVRRILAWYFFHKGFHSLAHKFFHSAISKFHRTNLKYQEACSHRDYGLFLDKINWPGAAQDSYNHANQIFKSINATYEYEKISPLLENIHISSNQPASPKDTPINPIHGYDDLQFETLYEHSSSIISTDNYDSLLKQLLLGLIKATGAQYGSLLLDNALIQMDFQYSLDHLGNPIELPDNDFINHIFSQVQKSRSMIKISDATEEYTSFIQSKRVRSVLCLPLLRGVNYFGAIYLGNDIVSNLFSISACKTAQILTAQASVLIENAKLVDEYKRLNKTLEQKVADQTRDLTFKKQQLQNTNLKLIESERMRSILNGTLIHDIKNCVFSIAGDIRYIEKKADLQDESKKRVKKISRICNDIFNLSMDVLDIGKMEEGNLQIKPEAVTKTIIQAQIDLLNTDALIIEKNIKIYDNLDENLTFFADIRLLERLLQNLLNNASKYTLQDGKIVLSWSTNHNESILSIYNTSSPIPENDRSAIFDKYYRIGGSYARQSKGVGLYFCKIAMQAHKGRIWVESDQDGNNFRLAFPN